jgi:holliday junction DNA helicase RuvB
MSNFFDWLVQPVVDLISSFQYPNDNNMLDEDERIEIVCHTPETFPKKTFRPSKFEEYIGQNKAKNILQSYIKATKERNITLPHLLIYGPPGCGKTTLAQIIARELQKPYVENIASTFSDIWTLFYTIQSNENCIVFLDEIHAIERQLAEKMYSLMEDFKLNNQAVKPFTLIGATTEYGELLADRRPFVDRFKIIIELEDYTIRDIFKISRQYNDTVFPFGKDFQHDNIHEIIALNARGTPRTAIRLLEATIYLNGDIKQVLNNFSIIKNSYTLKDLKVLNYINLNEKGVGLQGLSSYLGTSTTNYMQEIEPYLLKNELIIRSPRGRKITEKGKEMIDELQKEVKC